MLTHPVATKNDMFVFHMFTNLVEFVQFSGLDKIRSQSSKKHEKDEEKLLEIHDVQLMLHLMRLTN